MYLRPDAYVRTDTVGRKMDHAKKLFLTVLFYILGVLILTALRAPVMRHDRKLYDAAVIKRSRNYCVPLP